MFAALPFASGAPMVVALALGAGLATGFFRPAVFAGVPNLVPEVELASANALLQGVENASWAVGPVLGGLLTAAAGPAASYWINAASFVFSMLLVLRIPAQKLQSEKAITRGHWRDLADGFAAVVRSRPLLAVLLAWGVAELGVGGGNVAEIFLAKNTFHAGDFGYGLLYSAIGGGLVLGSFASTTVLARLGIAFAYGVSLAAMAVGFAGTAASPNVWVAACCCLVSGVGNGCAIVCNALLVQRGVADSARGRALTFVMSATYVLAGVGNAIGGLALHQAGPRWIWAGAAGCFFVASALGYALARGTGLATEEESGPAGAAPSDRAPSFEPAGSPGSAAQ